MTKNRNSDQVGDVISPSLAPSEAGLRFGADQAKKIQTETFQAASKPSVIHSFAAATSGASAHARSVTNCKQILWFSFFFDGTGNRLFSDEKLKKHSNVARLYRAHRKTDQAAGIYAFYLQGVGTFFPEVDDKGGGTPELSFGTKGKARLQYALKQFDSAMKRHLELAKAPANAILEINFSVFGFSRGAALSRAFVNLLLEERCVQRNGKWVLKNGFWPVKIRFLGLFDTVASVGLPMGSNNMDKIDAVISNVNRTVRTRLNRYGATRPIALAYSKNGVGGADPAPGRWDGHNEWGNKLNIDSMVEEVRHFIAAHEVRNSFPVDSVSVLRGNRITKPAHFYESVYPGVHSDVGGSYAPGEGGRAFLPNQNLGLVPLMHMYTHALGKGVPLLPVAAWTPEQRSDFEVDSGLVDIYNHYMKAVGVSANLGDLMNRHMGLYYAWRFRAIHRKLKGDQSEAKRVSSAEEDFKKQRLVLDKEIAELERKEQVAVRKWQVLSQRNVQNGLATVAISGPPASRIAMKAEVDEAKQDLSEARRRLLDAKARKLSVPNMEELDALIGFYDKQLLQDVEDIRAPFFDKWRRDNPAEKLRHDLRPHYKVLVEAYENEFVNGRGLSDKKVISFFDNYVHDSLAGFAKDATLPSDPRVVYLGGDEKFEYAFIDRSTSGNGQEVEVA